MKYCGNCRAALDDNAVFCPNCGAQCQNNNAAYQQQPVAPAPYTQPVAPAANFSAVQQPPTQKKTNPVLIVLIALAAFLVIAAIVLVILLGTRSTNSTNTVVPTEAVTVAETTTVPTTAAPTTAPVTETQPAPTQPPAPTTMPVAQPTTQPSIASHGGTPSFTNYYTIVLTRGSNLNMRSGPGSNYKVIGSIPNQAEVYVLELYPDWALVYYNNKKGWVSSDYLGGVSP